MIEFQFPKLVRERVRFDDLPLGGTFTEPCIEGESRIFLKCILPSFTDENKEKRILAVCLTSGRLVDPVIFGKSELYRV